MADAGESLSPRRSDRGRSRRQTHEPQGHFDIVSRGPTSKESRTLAHQCGDSRNDIVMVNPINVFEVPLRHDRIGHRKGVAPVGARSPLSRNPAVGRCSEKTLFLRSTSFGGRRRDGWPHGSPIGQRNKVGLRHGVSVRGERRWLTDSEPR